MMLIKWIKFDDVIGMLSMLTGTHMIYYMERTY